MACAINLFDIVIIGEQSGGTLEYYFYDSDQDGLPDNGGSPIDIGADGTVDFSGAIEGDYYFRYFGGVAPCDAELIFHIRVREHVEAGAGMTIDLCDDADPVNVFSLILAAPDPGGVWSGSGPSSPGWIPNADPTLVEFDPTLVTVGVYEFIYTVSVINSPGYTLSTCDNCAPQSTTVTIHVITCGAPPPNCNTGTSNSVSVCSSAGCTFDLFDQLGGTPTSGGEWTWLSGPAVIIPTGSVGTVNFLNAPIGTYQFQYDIMNLDPTCTSTAIITVQVVAQPNAGCHGNLALCENAAATNVFPSLGCSPNVGGTWTISPLLPFGTFTPNGFINPATGDAGTYIATYTLSNPVSGPCGTTCVDTETVTITITANCAALPGSTTICSTASITMNPAVLIPGSTPGGSWGCAGVSVNCNNSYTQPCVFSVNGAPAADHFGQSFPSGSVFSNFAPGCYLFIYTCTTSPNPYCGAQAEFVIHVTDCSPSCAATVAISAVACALSSTITGTCPSPIYEWQVQTTPGNFIAAPTPNNLSTYTGLNGQTYRLKVTGCTNCQPLYSSPLTVSCPPATCFFSSITLTYETALQRLKATFVLSSATAQNVSYQFNKFVNNATPCTSCTTPGAPQGTGVIFATPGTTYTVYFSTPQGAIEECWRFAATTTSTPICGLTACAKIPAVVPLMSYYILSLQSFTEITGVTVTIGGVDQVWSKATNPSQFNCNNYQSTIPPGNCNGVNNCSLAQLVNDINQKLTAGGYAGKAFVIQSSKSSSIRVSLTDIIFKNILRTGGGPIEFTTTTTTGCDGCTWHFQQIDSTINFGLTLDASAGGTQNLYTLLQLFMPEIVNTGTFTKATGTTTIPVCSGCLDINTTCLASVGATITIQNGGANHGLLTWSSFVPLSSPCGFNLVYSFTMPVAAPGNCVECIMITVDFVT